MWEILTHRAYHCYWTETAPEYLRELGFREKTVEIMVELGRQEQHDAWMKRSN